jgi:soluble lytic murein transglycosylase-like protein
MTLLLALLLSGTTANQRYDREIGVAVADVATVYPVPAALVKAVMKQESSFNPKAQSKAGAVGLMQVMPANASRVGLKPEDLWNPERNILAGVRLLAVLLRYYQGDLESVLVAYNAGPRKLFAPIPRNGETPEYVQAVVANYRAFLLHEVKAGAGAPSTKNPPRR